ncbi:hypothetical protein FHX62_002704 [Cupriavidus alkaliphilus]|nr:hypothetical protein [Cupriavidus alkaliphilus]
MIAFWYQITGKDRAELPMKVDGVVGGGDEG